MRSCQRNTTQSLKGYFGILSTRPFIYFLRVSMLAELATALVSNFIQTARREIKLVSTSLSDSGEKYQASFPISQSIPFKGGD